MRTLTDELAAVMSEWLNTIAKQAEEGGREAVQTVVWLVGLSSGLITLFAVKSGIITSVSTGQRRALLIALSTTVVCGVLQRVTYQLAERKQRNQLLGLQAHLVAYEHQLEEPDELNERWDRNEIVLRIVRDFNLDLSPLNEFNIPIDFYQKVYNNHVEGRHRFQSERLRRLGEVIAAYSGMSAEQGAKIFQVDQLPNDDLSEVRKKASSIHWLLRAAFFLFAVTCIGFVSPVLLLGYAIFP